MHTLQWVIVEADDVDTAASVADNLLTEEMGGGDTYNTWYDWFVVGGGRWNSEDNDDISYNYVAKTNMIIAFEDNPNAFSAKLQELIANRIETYNEYLAEFKESSILSILEEYGGAMTYSPELYSLSRLVDFQLGRWNWDSKFYDLVHYSTNATHILSKIDSGLGENLYLVPIDFHF